MLLYKIKIFDKLGELVSVGSISNLATSSREHRIMPTSHPRSREFFTSLRDHSLFNCTISRSRSRCQKQISEQTVTQLPNNVPLLVKPSHMTCNIQSECFKSERVRHQLQRKNYAQLTILWIGGRCVVHYATEAYYAHILFLDSSLINHFQGTKIFYSLFGQRAKSIKTIRTRTPSSPPTASRYISIDQNK